MGRALLVRLALTGQGSKHALRQICNRYALSSCVALALLAGCGASLSPSGGLEASVSQRSENGPRQSSHSFEKAWISADVTKQTLLYVGGNNDAVTVYSYPKGKLVGTLYNSDFDLPAGECVDRGGDVFITSLGNKKVFEYRHGGKTPIATLQTVAPDPGGCSSDPKTGNLAVSALGGFGYRGDVEIYANARGTPSTFSVPKMQHPYSCAYDSKGNLFVEGQKGGGSYTFEFAELPAGADHLRTIRLNENIGFPGGVQWDGKYVVVGDQDVQKAYAFSIKGSIGRLQHTTPFNDEIGAHQFWISRNRVVAADHSYGVVDFYDYPKGGNPIKVITKGVAGPDGLTISEAGR